MTFEKPFDRITAELGKNGGASPAFGVCESPCIVS